MCRFVYLWLASCSLSVTSCLVLSIAGSEPPACSKAAWTESRTFWPEMETKRRSALWQITSSASWKYRQIDKSVGAISCRYVQYVYGKNHVFIVSVHGKHHCDQQVASLNIWNCWINVWEKDMKHCKCGIKGLFTRKLSHNASVEFLFGSQMRMWECKIRACQFLGMDGNRAWKLSLPWIIKDQKA